MNYVDKWSHHMLFLVALSGAVVFESTVVQPGSYIVKTIETSATKLIVDLSVTEAKGKLELIAVPQANAHDLFGGYPKCKSNLSILQLDSNVKAHRKILKFSDSLVSKDEHTHDINIETQDLWVFMLSNCGSDPVTFTGNATLNCENGFLDGRYALYKFISLVQIMFVGVFLVVFYLRVVAGKPFTVSLTRSQKLIIFIGGCIVINGLENIGLFYRWNITSERPSLIFILIVITKTVYQGVALYTASQMIMTWKDVPVWPFAFPFILLLLANLFEHNCATGIGERLYFSWGFGFHPVFRFWLIYYVIHGATVWFAHLHPRTEDEITEEEAAHVLRFQSVLKYLWSAGVVTCAVITVLVLARVLRNCAWLCYSLEPIFFVSVLLIEAHFCQRAKTSGWVPLGSDSMSNIPVIANNDPDPLELSDGGIPALISASFSSDEGGENAKAD